MVAISVYDEKEIDTTSDEVRNKIAESVAKHILDHWDECVNILNEKVNNRYEARFEIKL